MELESISCNETNKAGQQVIRKNGDEKVETPWRCGGKININVNRSSARPYCC